jgi:hypothetical protein
MFRRSDFRNARSVRKGKSSRQILIAVTNQMPMKCPHPNGHESKNRNTHTHRNGKLYVQPIIHIGGNADAENEWGRMTPSPNEIVWGKSAAK